MIKSVSTKSVVIVLALLLPNYPIAGQETTASSGLTFLQETVKVDASQVWGTDQRDEELRFLHILATNLPSWQIAADNHQPEGQFLLGKCFEHGVGLPREPKIASNWYRKAAEQGLVFAQYALLDQKLDAIVIPKFEFTLAGLAGVLNQIADTSRKIDMTQNSGNGINIVLRGSSPDASLLSMTFNLQNVPLRWLLRYACDMSGNTFWMEKDACVIAPWWWKLTLVKRKHDRPNESYCALDLTQQRQLLELTEGKSGPDHPDTANCLVNLATVYVSIDDYAMAEQLCQRALAIWEKALGPDHPDTANGLDNLAWLYREIGDYAKAEPLYRRALAIREKALGPYHADTIWTITDLAVVSFMMCDYAKAEMLYLSALKTYESRFGTDDLRTASTLNYLACLYRDIGDYAKAEPLLKRSVKIVEKVRGPEDPDTALSLNDLAELYVRLGDYAKAEPLYRRALAIREKALRPDHPDTASTLGGLAALSLYRGRLDIALSLAVKQQAALEKNLNETSTVTSERERMKLFHNRSNNLFATLGTPLHLAQSLLRSKNVILDSLLEDQLAAETCTDPEIRKATEQLRLAVRRRTQLQMDDPKDSITDAQVRQRQKELGDLGWEVEHLQQTLARNGPPPGLGRRALRIEVPNIQAALTSSTVLLEFVRYAHFLGKGEFEFRYGVVLIGSPEMAFMGGNLGEPAWVHLGPAKIIEQSLKEYGLMMRGEIRGDITLLRTLYTQLFEPIQKRLPEDITTLIISPDAELNFVSFATLVNKDKFLAEQYDIEYVSSGRDLLLKRNSPKGLRRFTAFANPAFGQKPMMAGSHGNNAVQLAMLSSDRRDYAGVSLGSLPNTIQEAQFLRDRSSSWNMEGTVYVGAEATEAEVKAVKSPHVLHLATHGFFLPDTLPTNRLAKGRFLVGNERTPTVLHNPMQRSGLAFAGAQLTLDAWKKGQTPNTENDGILMGQEIGTIDLKETWLVVLSACDTGIGEARAGEGVLGLRRGFIRAGAQNLLMTLWPVSDKYTVDLMKAFYERALKDNNAPQALAKVQRDFLVKIRKEKNAVIAARLAGPFVMTFQGRN